jgi:hypothetical protein
MKIRHVLAASALAGGLLAVGAAPAFAAGPPVPPGCTFDQATGVETCVTTTAVTGTFGPFSTPSTGDDPTSDTFDGATGLQLCDAEFGALPWAVIGMNSVSFTGTVTTTTTTERHGLNGEVFDTSTSKSASVNSLSADAQIGCAT